MIVLAMVETKQNKEVMAGVYEREYKAIYKQVRHIVKNDSDAEDVAVGTFVKFIDKFQGLPMKTEEEILKATGYLATMARNEARELLRRRKREEKLFCYIEDISEIAGGGDCEELLIRSDPGPVALALRQLEERDRNILLLYTQEDHSFDRMLERLGLGRQHKEALRSQVARAKKRLIALANRISEEVE